MRSSRDAAHCHCVDPVGGDAHVDKKPRRSLKTAPLPAKSAALDSFGFTRKKKLNDGQYHQVGPAEAAPVLPQHVCPECKVACLSSAGLAHRNSHRSDHVEESNVSVAEFWNLRVENEKRFDSHAFGDSEARRVFVRLREGR